jgi:MFS family permease
VVWYRYPLEESTLPLPRAMNKAVALIALALTQVAVLSLWFATAAAAPGLQGEFGLSDGQLGLLVSAVQAGFVLGSIASAFLGLADRIDPRLFYAIAAAIGATANALFIATDPGSSTAVILRGITGAAMAGVYPIGMKIAVSWANKDRGLLVGLLVGALTLGSASPHLFAFLGGVEWRLIMGAASAAALIGAAAILFVPTGPNLGMSGKFEPTMALTALHSRPLRLANLGYLGHMWELYAMWAWIGAFLAASFAAAGMEAPVKSASIAAFGTIAVGFIGAIGGGFLADRIGRTTLTMAAMTISAACCLAAGFIFGGSPAVVLTLCAIWGITIIADSAQFSACISELSPPGLTGTMLTTQTAAGFALTLVTIQLMPVWVDLVGWNWAFAPLAIGPILGTVAMARLRRDRAAFKLAGGKR